MDKIFAKPWLETIGLAQFFRCEVVKLRLDLYVLNADVMYFVKCFLCTYRFGRISESLSTDVNRTDNGAGAELKAREDEKSSPQRRRNVENDKDWEEYWEHCDNEGSGIRQTTV